MAPFDDRDRRAVTALRALAIDQVEQARSGHPGMPLGAAPMAWVLWSRFLRHDPADPTWADRDRFVLSAGHGSALLYALLHLFGYDLPLEELRRFRQLGSRTPGHPEHGLTRGVETTTGPLGQGIANAVGMALAEAHLAARFNRDGLAVVAHRTWAIAGDGDLMEGISHEAASLAGHLRLGRLAVLWDDNRITIEGPTSLAVSEDTARRFAAYGWQVLEVEDGNDLDAIAAALAVASASEDAPTLIRVRTHIGFGAPTKQDTAEAHGAPLGAAEALATKKALGWEIAEPFTVPGEVRDYTRGLATERAAARSAWVGLWTRYADRHPAEAAELERRWRGDLPTDWDAAIPAFAPDKPLATREASGVVLNALAGVVPELLGGSADLAPSNNTAIGGEDGIAPGRYAGRNLHFGVREHAMAAIANGLALHGGIRPYAATFLVFSDYLRPALRLSALMGAPVVYVFTHDSVAVGEDGPTHQPVEQLVALRVIPGLVVLRPADAHEAAEAWRLALARRDGPTALVLSRQKLPVLAAPPRGAVARGAYVKAEASGGDPVVVLVGTGSEVALALEVRARLEADGIPTRVVSAPSLELLKDQNSAYHRTLFGPPEALRVAVEMGRGQGWHRWVGDGEIVVLSRFGASGPGGQVASALGFSVDAVLARVRSALGRRRRARLDAAVPAPLAEEVSACRARLDTVGAATRLRALDATLWGEDCAGAVARRLGWLDLPGRARIERRALERAVAALAGTGARTLVLAGMGGSSLAPRVLRQVLGNPSGRELVVLDTTDPDHVARTLGALAPVETAFLAVSKSGTTAETSALTEIAWQRMSQALGADAAARFATLTEPGTALDRLAGERGFAVRLPHPFDVGGRFSALSAVGLLPALWLGHDTDALVSGAERALADLAEAGPAAGLAALLAASAQEGWARLAWCASPSLAPLGGWAEQLVAESTGKSGRGVLPVLLTAPPAGAPWPATLYLSPRWCGEDTAELDAALDRIAAAGAPVARLTLRPGDLGGAFMTLELATAVLGVLLGINPFDEPDVVRAKERARAALTQGAPAPAPFRGDLAAVLLTHIQGISPLDAVALLAYLPEDGGTEEALDALAAATSHRVGAPATWGFGPRYLHSTGQLHKGGPDRIRPVVLTASPRNDLAIPGQAHSLGQLRLAQALGDVAALREVGRDVLHVHLGADAAAELLAAARALAR